MKININEVVTRDGLQIEKKIPSTKFKVNLIDQLMDAGVKRFELTSFVHPKYVPQMADAEDLFSEIDRRSDVVLSALVLNDRGVKRAKRTPVDELNITFSLSETHNRKNANSTVSESIQLVRNVLQETIPVNVCIGTAFGCPFEGLYETEQLIPVIESVVEYNPNSISLGDTTGMANPRQVEETCYLIRSKWPEIKLGLHLHNSRGMGLANVLAGIRAGVHDFDTALGGIGGCPFAPGATGNICTEDTVHMLEQMGYETGIVVDKLIQAAKGLEQELGKSLPGQIMKSGKSTATHPA
ncbi:hydroxymethylglutaryl-CoA lyase [Alkalihalobacillus sp. AL-G]|uniref:hydroxymethylglutaryl-CoA lyase n=1 Tax=Alkalihalobacillus sp. AL-G TaxID=2926399 RepID=UPI002729F8E7|nr:hydroxymethylglutaryl-CoA lyase [Alkalihalobacillus sp. AL-G]WLD94541.1 hydroxymethylglutaryl-CoA lyase [Alkalihalobacillus sp. AL-G]